MTPEIKMHKSFKQSELGFKLKQTPTPELKQKYSDIADLSLKSALKSSLNQKLSVM